MQEHRAELEELYAAVVLGKPVYHSGEWGAATLEACIVMMQSAREHRELPLERQVAMPRAMTTTWNCPKPKRGR